MGKKGQKKILPSKDINGVGGKKLSVQKKQELNQLIDTLLKLGFKQTNNITEQWSQYMEIQAILDRIQSIESVLKMKTSNTVNIKSRNANVEAFLKWAVENGAQYEDVKISEFSGFDLGLQAERDFNQGECFITIPKKMIMCEESLSIALRPIVTEIPMFDTMSNVKLAFALLLEKINPDSFWRPYIDILPEKYSTVMYFSSNEMQELKGSNALSQALNQCKNIARQYAFINKCIQNVRHDKHGKDSIGYSVFDLLKDKFTYDLYRWSVSAIMTRQNAIPRTGPSPSQNSITSSPEAKLPLSDDCGNLIPALIPLWDMANHCEGIVTSSYNMELDRIESTTLSEFKKGEQIFIYYGNRSNTDLLVHNGFVYPNNLKDYVSIRLGLSNSDQLLTKRCQLLEQLNISKNGELNIYPSPDFISSQLLAFVRIFNMNHEQIQHWINSERALDLLHIDCALDTSLETKTWTFLETRLNLLLKVFPTTLEHDLSLLSNHQKGQTKLGYIKSMLLQYRILEKKILMNALDYAKQRTKA